MSQYRIGTVDVANGDANVYGNGTSWLTEATVGDWFSKQGVGEPIYQVLTIVNDTQITLSVPYAGVTETAISYWVFRDFTSPNNIPILSAGDVDTNRVLARMATTMQSDVVFDPTKDQSITGDYTFSGDFVDIEKLVLSTQSTPASATAAGTKGDVAHDTNYIYICTATNVWKRVALSTW